MRIAVTGANGFVGRHVCAAASAERHEVVGVVRSERAAQVVAGAGARPARVERLTPEALAPAFEGVAAVVHLAQTGEEGPGRSYADVNLGGTRAVAAAARQAGVPRVVYFSGLGVARYGQARRCTIRYFLSKLACEVELLGSGLEAVVFRPSYVLGPGGELVAELLRELRQGEVELIGDGRHRMQPIAVRDAAAVVIAGAQKPATLPLVYDLVGPEPVSYAELVARVARLAGVGAYRTRSISEAEAERQARAGGYRGMGPDTLDCLLCDEVSSPGPLEALLGSFLTPLDAALAAAVRAAGRVVP